MFDSKTFIRTLPEDPGVYRMIGVDEAVLYVGKAKNLKRRVSSYFQRSAPSPRIALMVAQVLRVDITVTRSEAEALILENNLIKSLAPKYNILFRDDKSYPFICISGDAQPRLAFHRGPFDKGSRYFGPFPNSLAVRDSLHLLQRIFLLRTCENSVFQNRSRPCLLFQIKRCSGACVGMIDEASYRNDVRMAMLFLDGKHSEVVRSLEQRMHEASDRLAYEEAALFRDQIRSVQAVLHRQYVSSDRDEDVDVIVAVQQGGFPCVNLAMVRAGRHLGDRPLIPQGAGEDAAVDALLAFVEQHYRGHDLPQKIIVNIPSLDALANVLAEVSEAPCKVAAPRTASEKAWVEMAEKNALHALEVQALTASRTEARVQALQQLLELDDVPARIECFDISHTMGEGTVASCVVFVESAMKKSEYRRYNISGITPGDDYAAMRSALTRRYEKVASGEGVCPDLILIDGGKGQVGIAREVLADCGLDHVPMIGVAKGVERKPGMEELVFPDGRDGIHLPEDHPALHLIQQIRDEAHRFAIGGHRARRAKVRRESALENVPGIGPARRKKLLSAFGGLAGVRDATPEDLCRVAGINRKLAEQIHEALR